MSRPKEEGEAIPRGSVAILSQALGIARILQGELSWRCGRSTPPLTEVKTMATGKAILNTLRQELNLSDYRKKHWEGSFDEYLDIVREHPEVTRSAYQRLYEMLNSH